MWSYIGCTGISPLGLRAKEMDSHRMRQCSDLKFVKMTSLGLISNVPSEYCLLWSSEIRNDFVLKKYLGG